MTDAEQFEILCHLFKVLHDDMPFCGECDGPCTHKGEAECALCGQDGCDTLHLLADGWGWKGGDQ